jgi:hypothetical protein
MREPAGRPFDDVIQDDVPVRAQSHNGELTRLIVTSDFRKSLNAVAINISSKDTTVGNSSVVKSERLRSAPHQRAPFAYTIRCFASSVQITRVNMQSELSRRRHICSGIDHRRWQLHRRGIDSGESQRTDDNRNNYSLENMHYGQAFDLTFQTEEYLTGEFIKLHAEKKQAPCRKQTVARAQA